MHKRAEMYSLWDTCKVLVHGVKISGTVTVTCIAELTKQSTLQIAGAPGPHFWSSRAFTMNLWQSHADWLAHEWIEASGLTVKGINPCEVSRMHPACSTGRRRWWWCRHRTHGVEPSCHHKTSVQPPQYEINRNTWAHIQCKIVRMDMPDMSKKKSSCPVKLWVTSEVFVWGRSVPGPPLTSKAHNDEWSTQLHQCGKEGGAPLSSCALETCDGMTTGSESLQGIL